jgi:hypothetical protein
MSTPKGNAFSEYERDAEARASDLEILRALTDCEHEIPDDTRKDFDDMLDRMQKHPTRFPKLTEKQRAYAEAVANRHGIDFSDGHPIRAADVPRGREVETPGVLSRDRLRHALDARRRGGS